MLQSFTGLQQLKANIQMGLFKWLAPCPCSATLLTAESSMGKGGQQNSLAQQKRWRVRSLVKGTEAEGPQKRKPLMKYFHALYISQAAPACWASLPIAYLIKVM